MKPSGIVKVFNYSPIGDYINLNYTYTVHKYLNILGGRGLLIMSLTFQRVSLTIIIC